MDRQKNLVTLQSLMHVPSIKNSNVREIGSSSSQDSFHSTIINIIDEEAPSDPFYIMDISQLVTLYQSWTLNLPSIRPFFPVRCNPDPVLLSTLSAIGAGFDCGSRHEIERLQSLSVPMDRIIFSNPCKSQDHIKYAARVGVTMLLFDSIEELDKVHRFHPHCSLLLHIHVPFCNTEHCKYGALAHEVAPILRHAQCLGLNIVGISLEPEGSGSQASKVDKAAIDAAHCALLAFDQLGLPKPRMLNVGGGFKYSTSFPQEANAMHQLLQVRFKAMTVIAGPGRFLSETACVLVANVIGKRVRGDVREYWINDGVYGSMNGVVYHQKGVKALPFAYASHRANPTCKGLPTFPSTVFGPTCDALDTVFTGRQLPELCVGDWLVFPNMGAYTHASATNFNGFFAANIRTRYIFTKPSCQMRG